MIKKVLRKLTDKQKESLSSSSLYYEGCQENTDKVATAYWKGKTQGYIDALYDLGQITRVEKELLSLHYTRERSTL